METRAAESTPVNSRLCPERRAKGSVEIAGLGGKLVGAYTTAQYVHGGGELGIREMLDHCMVMGALTYSGGGSCGKPVIHLGPVGIDNTLDINKFSENFVIYGTRMATKAMEIFASK